MFRVAALYIVGAWVVMQAADVLFPALGIPDAAIRALLVAAVIGFPVALVFGWLFDIGPDGIQRCRPAGTGEAATQRLPDPGRFGPNVFRVNYRYANRAPAKKYRPTPS